MRGSILKTALNTKDTCLRAALQSGGYIYVDIVLLFCVASEVLIQVLIQENRRTREQCLDTYIVGSHSEEFLLY